MTKNREDMPRKIPALIAYLHPFRVIESSESGEWKTDIDQINKREWDFVKLHEIVGGLDVGLPAPYHLVIGFDGALALPPIPELRDPQKAVEFYNRCLAALLLGGIYCEAVNIDSLQFGSILDWKYIRVSKRGTSSASVFHHLVRMKMSPPIESIALLNPKKTKYEDLYLAMKEGMTVINQVPNLSPEFLLKGVSGLARLDWGAALSNLWIVVEQVVEYLWQERVIKTLPTGHDKIEGQKEQLTDVRTWSIANRIELLYQKNIIPTSVIKSLSKARKSRNKLVHDGSHPEKVTTWDLYNAILEILKIIVHRDFPLSGLDLTDHALSDPFNPPKRESFNPEYWMPFPKLPGEDEIDLEEIKKDQ